MSMIGFSIFNFKRSQKASNGKISLAEKVLLDHLHNDKFEDFKTVFERENFSPNFVTYVSLVANFRPKNHYFNYASLTDIHCHTSDI